MNATTTNGSVRPILVGIDGSSSALAAARWAAREAVVRRAPIRLVYAFGWMPVHDADDPVQIVPDARDALRRTAEERLAAAAAQVGEVAPDVAVSQEVTTGMAAALLVSLSGEAQLAVVGHRGLGGFAGLVIGSVSAALAAHAACPVVVVRGPDAPLQDGPVVVGVDGSPQSEAALAFAVEAAVARRVPLRAVRAWLDPAVPYVVTGPADWDEEVKRQQGLLSEQLVGWREKYPELRVEPVLVQDRPAHALAQSTGDAQLVVVGSRGRGGLTGMLLGSVSQAMLQHAECPVAVVR
jgi:nucleotide-binding universal stress UspA family protein